MGMINAYKILVGKPGGKRLLGRPRSRWEDNNKLDHIRLEAFTVSELDKMFSGNTPCQL
jgi:hypothetical protein